MKQDWLIQNARVISLQPEGVQTADLRIRGDQVVEMDAQLAAREDENIWDARGKLVLPGLVNAHTHLYSALARGMPAPAVTPRNFLEILQQIWWRLDRALDEESIYYSALIAGIEAARSGTTTVIDHHASPECIAGSLHLIQQALAEVGLRGILCYEVTDRGGAQKRDLGLRENDNFLAQHAADPMFRGLVGAHASFTLSDRSLRACAELAQHHGSGVHLHLAEDGCDAEISAASYGRGDLVRRLHDHGLLQEGTLLAHGIHLTREDFEFLNQQQCWLVHNARSNMNNAVGHAPVQHFGARAALGTDGFPADMFEETRLAFFRGREARSGLGPQEYLRLLYGGHALCTQRFGRPFGELAPGVAADMVFLDYAAPTPMAAGTLPSHVLLGMKTDHVTEVMVAGHFIVQDRTLLTVNVESTCQKARAVAERLWRRLEG